ncbi:MAG: hypothetical protein EOP54_20530, partial [Sphingobacteriales bacterium]
MLKKTLLLAVAGMLLGGHLPCYAQPDKTANPLLVHSNAPVQFKNVTAKVIRDASAQAISKANTLVQQIVEVPAGGKTFANTMMVFDEVNYALSDLQSKVYLIASTYSDDSTRNAAIAEAGNLDIFFKNLYLNEGLYKAIKSYSTVAALLRPDQQKFLNETVFSFEKNGMKLNKDDRSTLSAINEKITTLGLQFDKNIAEWNDSLVFTAAQLKGVPAEFLTKWKKGKDRYVVSTITSNYSAVVENADNEDIRKSMYMRYMSRAYPGNVQVLDSLLYYRDKYAKKLGFTTYAEYALADKMAAKPANVWSFENDLISKLTPNVTKELATLGQVKTQGGAGSPVINQWDMAYYNKKLLNQKY